MSNDEKKSAGPDLAQGVPAKDLAEGGMLTGHVGDDEVLVVRQAGRLYAVSAHCTHYHGPLADGLLIGETIRCPWHHAHFSLDSGEAVAAPALSPLGCWRVEERDGKIIVAEKNQSLRRRRPADPAKTSLSSVAVRPASPRPRCCAATAMRAMSR